MASRIGKTEWMILLAVAASIDFIQFVVIECILVWFFGVGAAINEILDPIISAITIGYFTFLRKVNLFKYPSRILSMAGVQGLETFTGGIAQLWFLEILYLKHSVNQEYAAEDGVKEQESLLDSSIRQPQYKNGIRQPYVTNTSDTRNPGPLNQSGISRARGVR